MAREPISLIDTRKRKFSPIQSSSSTFRPSSENTSSMQPPPRVDLGAILRPTNIPKEKYYKIQGILIDQERAIADRGKEIRDRCTQIHDLQNEVSDANARIDRDGVKIEKGEKYAADLKSQLEKARAKMIQDSLAARERKQYFKDREAEFTQTMDLGRKCLADKTKQASQFEKENEQLRATVGARDGTISSLNHQILRISNASVDEAAVMAMDVQARRSLDLVSGLQNDVAKRDKMIAEYERLNQELTTINKECNAKNEQLKHKVAGNDETLQAAIRRVNEANAITQDQGKLIQRLMDENARLGATQRA